MELGRICVCFDRLEDFLKSRIGREMFFFSKKDERNDNRILNSIKIRRNLKGCISNFDHSKSFLNRFFLSISTTRFPRYRIKRGINF